VGAVLGTLAILLLAFSFGLLFFVSAPLAFAALMLGVTGRSRVERGLTARGRTAANAAMVLGIAGLVLSVVGCVYTALLLAGYWES
jgi:hypothetical protein